MPNLDCSREKDKEFSKMKVLEGWFMQSAKHTRWVSGSGGTEKGEEGRSEGTGQGPRV